MSHYRPGNRPEMAIRPTPFREKSPSMTALAGRDGVTAAAFQIGTVFTQHANCHLQIKMRS